jgi:hypothetical protein
MPWRVETPMSQRLQFVEALARGHWSMTELCARFGISRKTVYKWRARSEAEGADFAERSRRPQESPTRLDGELAARDEHYRRARVAAAGARAAARHRMRQRARVCEPSVRSLGGAWRRDARRIRPGCPVENRFIESFHGGLRDECLNTHHFRTLAEARNAIEA